MLVGRYRRTISFPTLNPNRPNPTPSKPYHVRSTSLPCAGRTHPSIPQLNRQLSLLLSWPHSKPILPTPSTTSSWLVNGLTQLKALLDSLDHILQTPLALSSLSRSGGARFVDEILDRFLRLLDAVGILHTRLLALKQELSSAQVALRRNDTSQLASFLRFHKKAAKEMARVHSSVLRSAADFPANGGDQTDEISAAIRSVLDVTASSVSAAVFGSVLESLAPARSSAGAWAGSVMGMGMRRKRGEGERKVELRRMEEMEERVEVLEKASGRVLRSLISNRVSLLNILTHLSSFS